MTSDIHFGRREPVPFRDMESEEVVVEVPVDAFQSKWPRVLVDGNRFVRFCAECCNVKAELTGNVFEVFVGLLRVCEVAHYGMFAKGDYESSIRGAIGRRGQRTGTSV